MRRLVGLALAASLWPAAASADIAVTARGRVLYIDRFERADDDVTLFLTGGGEVTVPAELVVNIVPNEIVEDGGEDPREVGLLPHLQPVIAPAASRHDLDPALVAAVIWAESSGDPEAVSEKGAQGLMQLMPATAEELGVVDALDPEENVEGGTRYLRQMLDAHGGDLPLALAAYNAGPEAVKRHGGVPPYRETQAYVRRVLRMYDEARGEAP